MKEIWKAVLGYEGLYEVSDIGRVRSLNYHREGKVKNLKNVKDNNGYEVVGLCRYGRQKLFKVHRLVWEAFVGQIPDELQIDHINTVRDDNRLSNLRVVTPKENNANPITAERNRKAIREVVKHRSKNTQWLENLREGVKRRSQDVKWLEANRESTRKSRNKTVLQLDKTTGEVIREWECARDVERELGFNHSNIAACCQGKRNSAGGYRWRFEE